MANLLKSNKTTIHRVITRDLDKIKRKKTKVHALKESHIKNRKTNARKMYETHLAGGKDEYVVTIDEGLFRVDNCNGERSICYMQRGENVPLGWVCEKKERLRSQIMIISALSGRGPLPLMQVS